MGSWHDGKMWWENMPVWGRCQPLSLSLSSLGGSAGKESACNAGDLGWIPRLGRSPGGGNSYPLQHSGLENSMNLQSVRSQRARQDWATFTFPSFSNCVILIKSPTSLILTESSANGAVAPTFQDYKDSVKKKMCINWLTCSQAQ